MRYCDDCGRLVARVAGLRDEGALISYIKVDGRCEYCGGPGPCQGVASPDTKRFEYMHGRPIMATRKKESA